MGALSMPTEPEFLAEIETRPEDRSVRLIYADWLEERGDGISSSKAELLTMTAPSFTATAQGGIHERPEEATSPACQENGRAMARGGESL